MAKHTSRRVPVFVEVLLLSERDGGLRYRLMRGPVTGGAGTDGRRDRDPDDRHARDRHADDRHADDRHANDRHADDRHPDEDARALTGLTRDAGAGLLHSSSWRYEDGTLVLTYVALPDPCPELGTRPVPDADPAVSDDPLAPAVEGVDTGPVAVHACRHLAFLAGTDPVVAEALDGLPAYRRLLRRFEPDVAGGLSAPTVV